MAKKKKFMVIARNKKIQETGVTTGKGHRTFGEKSVMWISDPAEAREIETQYSKKDIAVTTDQQYEWSLNNDNQNGTKLNNIHKYTFQGVDTSYFKVWVQVNGRLKRVTKDEAKRKGYEIISSSKEKPKLEQKRTIAQPQTVGGLDGL